MEVAETTAGANGTAPAAPTLSATNEAVVSNLSNGICKMVWWKFHDCLITPADLRSIANAAGFDPGVVKDIDPDSAVVRGVREFSVREGKRKVMEAVIADTSPTEIVINILELQEKTRRRMVKECVDTLVWCKMTQTWLESGTSGDAADTLRNKVKLRQTYYDGNAIRELLVMPALQASHSLVLRRGIYVVPTKTDLPVAMVQRALAGLDSFKLHVGTITKGAGFDDALQDAADTELRSELGELQEKIAGWNDLAGRVRSDTVETVLGNFKSLRERAGLYAEALSVALDDLQQDINEMETKALEIIDGRNTAPVARAAKPQKSRNEARREALASMKPAQLHALWTAMCDGEMPEDLTDTINALANEMEAKGM